MGNRKGNTDLLIYLGIILAFILIIIGFYMLTQDWWLGKVELLNRLME